MESIMAFYLFEDDCDTLIQEYIKTHPKYTTSDLVELFKIIDLTPSFSLKAGTTYPEDTNKFKTNEDCLAYKLSPEDIFQLQDYVCEQLEEEMNWEDIKFRSIIDVFNHGWMFSGMACIDMLDEKNYGSDAELDYILSTLDE